MKLKKQTLERVLTALLMVAVLTAFIPVVFRMGFVESYDVTNVTAIVNVTNSRPDITLVVVNANTSVTLSENATYRVTCNATVHDWNGFSDIKFVNATFFLNHNRTVDSPTDLNQVYRNASCNDNSSVDSFRGSFLCSVDVYYFAFNGTWNCTMYAKDNAGFADNESNTTSIGALWGMNVTDLINYGNLSVYQKSANISVNITNFGNQRINLSVFGYGGTNETKGQGWAMECPEGDNITIDNERFSTDNGSNWANMNKLTNTAATLENFTVPKQSTLAQLRWNTTLWTLYVPPNPYGECNGTVVFEAIYAGEGVDG